MSLSSFFNRLRPTAFSLLRNVGLLLFVFGAFVTGYLFRGAPERPTQHADVSSPADAATVWTCVMHPQIRQPKPGLCPICAMELVPVTSAQTAGDPRVYETSPEAAALMNIQTAPVERRFVEKEIRMVGKVDYDESKLADITAWVPGRIDRYFVDFSGARVAKGDHLVSLYSPELLTGQDELYRAAKALAAINAGAPETLRKTAEATIEAGRRKLKLWGMSDEAIKAVEQGGAKSDQVIIYSPIGGTVIEKLEHPGEYVEVGTHLFHIADLTVVWVKLDAYESDLVWLHYGQDVEFATEAFPGEAFHGRIAFIDPVVNEMTRTVKVRVNVDNADQKLKPEMFVRATIRAKVATQQRVMDPGLAGKWISPMHPQIIKDAPGVCDICGMTLVAAEKLGYVSADELSARPLVIPAAAALVTGKRAIVYVSVGDAEKPAFEGREIVLGPRAGDYYLVESGLEEGERVVTNGNFKIDSAQQLLARPSMMNRGATDLPAKEGESSTVTAMIEAPVEMRSGLRRVYERYGAIRDALTKNDIGAARASANELGSEVASIDALTVAPEIAAAWARFGPPLHTAIHALAAAEGEAAARMEFKNLSDALAAALETFGLPAGDPVRLAFCPMAFDKAGAHWLQSGEAIQNPYFGGEMLTCGEIKRVLLDEHGHAPHGAQ